MGTNPCGGTATCFPHWHHLCAGSVHCLLDAFQQPACQLSLSQGPPCYDGRWASDRNNGVGLVFSVYLASSLLSLFCALTLRHVKGRKPPEERAQGTRCCCCLLYSRGITGLSWWRERSSLGGSESTQRGKRNSRHCHSSGPYCLFATLRTLNH